MKARYLQVPAMMLILLMAGSVLSAPGDTIMTIPTPHNCPQGLTFDGEYLWNADRKSDQIYKLDPATGTVLDSLPTPGYIPRGVTWDGTRLWCVDGESEEICAINPRTRITEKTIYCPVAQPYGLAWDGKYLWISDDASNELHQISSDDGTTINSFRAPTTHPGGLTFDGTYLWVSDRFKDRIYMVTPGEGDVIITFKSPGPHPAGLSFDGKNLWCVDYQSDRISKLVVDDGTLFTRLEKKVQSVDFTHQVRNFGPGTMQALDVFMAVPQNMNNQELRRPVTFDPEPTDILTDKWGQRVAHFRFDDVSPLDFTTVTMHAEATLYQNRYFVFPDKVGGLSEIPDKIGELYLIDDDKFAMDDPVIRQAVKKAVGDETNPYWIGRKIFNYVIEHMEYELAGGWNIAPTVLARGNGSCSEYSFVYISMCRAAGLPARYVGSIVIRGDDASWDNVFHRWVEIYLPNYGWVPVDPSGGDSEWPGNRADAFGYLNNRFLITTAGGGGSEYLKWGYNANEWWTGEGRCKIEVENFGEWSPLEDTAN